MNLEYRRFSLSLRDPVETAGGRIADREGFLVRAREDGAVGVGEATPLAGWTESLEACERGLERARGAVAGGVGDALSAVDDLAAARHAVGLAFADLRARRASRPLYRHVGDGPRVLRVPVNATIGDAPAAEAVATARRAVDRGFDCCKLKVGARPVEADVERVRRVREAVGPEVELRIDANGAWTFEEAREAIEALADAVEVVEQPLPAGALAGHADLRGRGVAIALDEGLLEHGVDAVCAAGAADAAVLKPMALGGIDRARRASAWVSEAGIDPIVTTTIDGVVARTGAVHLAASIPDVPACGLATGALLAEDLGPDPVPIENGAAVVPQAKGLGVEGVWAE